MIAPNAELEIALRRGLEHDYDVELRFTAPPPQNIAETRGVGSFPASALLELQGLDPGGEEYGKRLFRMLFSGPEVLVLFRTAMEVSATGGGALQVRLLIETACPELHALHWEALRDPDDGAHLFTGDRVYFSRYISTTVVHPLELRGRGSLTALVVLVNPTDAGQFVVGGQPLAGYDVDEEEHRIRAALGDMPVDVLKRNGHNPAGTYVGLDAITSALRQQSHDILYLYCHGVLQKGEPRILLEKADGTGDVVSGASLVERLTELRNYPRLVVLASCQSAGTGDTRHSQDGGMLAALGPQLAGAGIPAVLAMQGDVAMSTIDAFMPVFFRALAADGQIDAAVALARGATRELPDPRDAWKPVLFMRLKGGTIWYTHAVTSEQGFTAWYRLAKEICSGTCTAILGPGLLDPYVGTQRELARKLADAHGFPLSPYEREDLAQVAQYVAVEQGYDQVKLELVERMCAEVQARYHDALNETARTVPVRRLIAPQKAEWFDALMRQAWQHRCQVPPDQGPPEPHRVLAQLPFPLYLSANPDDLLGTALAAHPEKRTTVEVYRWKDSLRVPPSILDRDPTYEPDARRPLVYHLFGKTSVPNSLVATQDDYLDALIALAGRRNLPDRVAQAMANSPLLFIGFQVDDWSFRVLYRLLMTKEAIINLGDFLHVAVQIGPEEPRFEDARAVKQYITKYFGEFSRVRLNIYWGSVQEFTHDLLVHCQPMLSGPGGVTAPELPTPNMVTVS